MTPRKSTDKTAGKEDFVVLISHVSDETFHKMLRAVSSDITPGDSRLLAQAFKEFKG